MRRLAGFGTLLLIVVVVFVVGQLVLPGLAASALRSRLSKSGRVLSVSVSAFPAVELLWHHADRVVVRMATYRSGSGHLKSLLDQTADVGTLRVSVASFDTGLLTLQDAQLRKQGSELTGRARVTEAALRAAVPFLESVIPVSAGNGSLTLRGTASLLGVSADADATVAATDGKIEVTPDLPFGGLITVTVFSDPHVYVREVSGGSAPGGLSVSARAQLR